MGDQPLELCLIDDALIATEQALSDTFLQFGALQRPVDAASVWDRSFQPILFPA